MITEAGDYKIMVSRLTEPTKKYDDIIARRRTEKKATAQKP